MTIVDCISDLHGFYPELEGGDWLIVAGDLTARDTEEEHDRFMNWMCSQPYDTKIFIAGNHDGWLEKDPPKYLSTNDFYYLEDSGCEIDGVLIYGSPYTPTFCDWHFMRDRGEAIRAHWDLIPGATDILITHGPPNGILDMNSNGERIGCHDLKRAIQRVKPKYAIFGHIHEGYGQYSDGVTNYINCAHCDEHYNPCRQPIRIEL